VARRAGRCIADLIVLVLVVNVTSKFVDPSHWFVAVFFVAASASGALKQLTAWRAGKRVPGIVSRFKHGWLLVSVIAWFAAMYPASHQLFQMRVPQMPLPVQTAGAVCLIFAAFTPFLRMGDLTRRAVDSYPQAIGSVLLTGNPLVALLVAAWIAVSGRAAWRMLKSDRLSVAPADPDCRALAA
jgi:hypothetical protein